MHRSIIGTKPTLLLYHGWLVVGAAFLVALYGFGLGFYGPGIYLVALNALHGWQSTNCPRRSPHTTFSGPPSCSSGLAPFLSGTAHEKLSWWASSRWQAV